MFFEERVITVKADSPSSEVGPNLLSLGRGDREPQLHLRLLLKSLPVWCGPTHVLSIVAASLEPLPNIEKTTPAKTLMVDPPKLNDQSDHRPSSKEHNTTLKPSSRWHPPLWREMSPTPRWPLNTYGHVGVPINAPSPYHLGATSGPTSLTWALSPPPDATPMYSPPNLVALRPPTPSPLPNLVYPTTTQSSLGELNFPANIHTPDDLSRHTGGGAVTSSLFSS
ncbi:hypothetical protein ACLOJK_012968 [Asimina triloba]